MLGIIAGLPPVIHPWVIVELRMSGYEAWEAVLLGFGMTYPFSAFAFACLWVLELWEKHRGDRSRGSDTAGALDSR